MTSVGIDATAESGNRLVSVITPSYNHGSYIRDTIESVLAQDYPHVEHIVVDGGSVDGTVEILREYGERYPDRFRWVSEPDKGQSDAFNKGLAMARGSFVGWQNSDDYYYPNVFGEAIQHLIDNPDVAAVYSECDQVNENGGVRSRFKGQPFDLGRLLQDNYIANQSAFIRTAVLRNVGGLPTDLHYVMDYDLWLRVSLRYRIDYVPGVRAAWRILPDAKSWAGKVHVLQELVAVIERVLSDPLLPPAASKSGREGLRLALSEGILTALSLDKIAIAVGNLQKAKSHGLEMPRYTLTRLLDHVVGSQDADERHALARVPDGLVRIFSQCNSVAASDLRQAIALSYLYRVIDTEHTLARHQAAAYVARALQTDRWWLARRSAQRALLQVLFGDQFIAVLRRLLRTLRLRPTVFNVDAEHE
jgi:hypothetical protein